MFPYDGYLQLAKDLSKKSDGACLRSAVSRAYYACFHLVKDYAEKHNESFAENSLVHDQVRAFLNNNADLNLQSIGKKQSLLKKARMACDYDKGIRDISKLATVAMLDAEQIFSVIKSQK